MNQSTFTHRQTALGGAELTSGSLCSGYGGLDLAIERFFGARTVWFSEFDQAPSKILAYRWPTVPNLGDMTKIDWASVPRVRILGGGTPCQDLSGAGRRKGMTEGTRSNLWVQMREAIAVIRPSLVVWENVRGAFSAYATSEVESESGLLGGYGLDRPALRALGRVLGDLSDLGYDTEWVGLRASDAGAPHARFRVFVLAYTDGSRGGRGAAQPGSTGGDYATDRSDTGDAFTHSGVEAVELGTGLRQGAPRGLGRGRSDDDTLEDVPDAAGFGCGTRWTESARIERGSDDHVSGQSATHPGRIGGERRGDAGDMAKPTRTGEVDREQWQRNGDAVDDRGATDWARYEPAIRRWESILGRVAPAPTSGSTRNGARRLNPQFEEWMMGLPAGWVTDPAIGLTWKEQVKALGNGVVPQQAELALSILWHRMTQAVAA